MKTDYKQIADVMQSQPVDRKWLEKDEFKNIAKQRSLKFIELIDTNGSTRREVWGNKNFQIIVLNENNKFQIL